VTAHTDIPERWDRTNRRLVLTTPWFSVHEEDYQREDGRSLNSFYIVEERDGTNVIALTEDERALIVHQFRPAVGRTVADFVGGVTEESDGSAISAAQRELLEETGYVSDHWHRTGVLHPAPHRLRGRIHCFVALEARPVTKPASGATESVEFEIVALRELRELIADGSFSCAVCLAALTLVQQSPAVSWGS